MCKRNFNGKERINFYGHKKSNIEITISNQGTHSGSKREAERERERETKKQSISNIQKVVDRIEMYLLQQITFKQRTKR